MKFFDPFWNPSFYKNKKEDISFWKGYLRLVLVCFVVSCVTASTIYIHFGKNIPSYFSSFTTKALQGYPPDLTLSVKNGVLSKSIPGLLQLYPASEFFGAENKSSKEIPKYLVAIDETKEASLAALKSSDAFFFFAKDGFIVESNSQVRINSYKSLEGKSEALTFSKGTLTQGIAMGSPYVAMVPTIITVGIVVLSTVFGPLANLVYLLLIGVVVMLLSNRLLGSKRTFGESYVLSLYALPSVMVLVSIVSLIPVVSTYVNKIPFLTTILVLVFLWLMFKKSPSQKDVPTHATLG